MRILYISQYFPPEAGAPSARVSELSRYWSEAGHEVTVLTGFPNHPTGKVFPAYRNRFRRLTSREWVDGVRVVRTWLWPLPNRKPHERILNYTSFCISAVLRGLVLRKPDVVIGTSPQLLVGVAAWFLARVKRAPFVFEVRDIWPDAILASGVGRPDSAMAEALAAISRFLYRRCDLLVPVTDAFVEELAHRWNVPRDKMTVVANGVDTEFFSPEGSMEARKGLNGKFVVSYVGTIGQAHGLSIVLDAADALRKEMPDAQFLIAGEGAEKELLESQAAQRGLDNVRFLGGIPRGDVPDLIRSSDVCLVLLKDAAIFRTVIPTKMLEFMACARPVILGVDGQAREILEQANAGVFITPDQSSELAREIRRLKANELERKVLGENGHHHIVTHMTRSQSARSYIAKLESLTNPR